MPLTLLLVLAVASQGVSQGDALSSRSIWTWSAPA